MNEQVNQELKRIKQMMTSIIKEDFEYPSTNSSIVDCESSVLDSDTMEIVVTYDQEDKYETYLISLDFEFEEYESQTYDNPGSSGDAIGSVNGIKMTYPGERILTPKEFNELTSNDSVSKCISSTIKDMEINAYEGRDTGPDPDDQYDRMREND